MIKRTILGVAILGLALMTCAQGGMSWVKAYGGPGDECYVAIKETLDDGYVMATGTDSFGKGGWDYLVMKIDASGNIVWQRAYGDTEMQGVSTISLTDDKGYIVQGSTEDDAYGMYLMKLSESGDIMWQKAYGIDRLDRSDAVLQTDDGGYISAGFSRMSGDFEDVDVVIMKLDDNGHIEWQKKYKGQKYEWLRCIRETIDGGFVFSGMTSSFGPGNMAAWVVKLDSTGGIIWQKAYGVAPTGRINANWIEETSDGGYIVAGSIDIAGDYENEDFWFMKLTSSGDIVWQKMYCGNYEDQAFSVKPTDDGGYVAGGWTGSYGAGGVDAWILKMDKNGEAQWQKTFGNELWGWADSILQTSDGGYAVGGDITNVDDSSMQVCIIKLDQNGEIQECPLLRNISVQPVNSAAEIIETTASVFDTSFSWISGSYSATTALLDRVDYCYIPCPTITMDPPFLDTAYVGKSYTVEIAAEGGEPPYNYFIMNGALPEGLGFSANGVISGMPTQEGRYAFAVKAVDIKGCLAYKEYSLIVENPIVPPVVASMVKLGNPFRIRVYGANLQEGARIYIGEAATPWTDYAWKSPGELIMKKGKPLKAMVPKGTSTKFKFVNPDGGETFFFWKW